MKYLLIVAFLLYSCVLKAQQIVPDSAINNVGKMSSVCGVVQSVFVSKTNTIYLSFGKPYPDNSFTAVIFASDTAKFTDYKPQDFLKEKDVCIMGKIELYKGKPQIVVKGPNQIRLRGDE